MRKTIITGIWISGILAIAAIVYMPVSVLGDAGGTISPISPFISSSSPNSITQRVYGTPIQITGLSDGCLGLSSRIVTSSGSACGSGSGGSAYPFTTLSNYGVNNSATNTPIWAQAGLNASSTSHFVNASTTAISAQSVCFTGDTCRTTWPTSSGTVNSGIGGYLGWYPTTGTAISATTGPSVTLSSVNSTSTTATSTFAHAIQVSTTTTILSVPSAITTSAIAGTGSSIVFNDGGGDGSYFYTAQQISGASGEDNMYKIYSYVTVSGVNYYSGPLSLEQNDLDAHDGDSYSVTVSWTPVPGATGYKLLKEDYPGTFCAYTFNVSTSTTQTSFLDTGCGIWTGNAVVTPLNQGLALPENGNASGFRNLTASGNITAGGNVIGNEAYFAGPVGIGNYDTTQYSNGVDGLPVKFAVAGGAYFSGFVQAKTLVTSSNRSTYYQSANGEDSYMYFDGLGDMELNERGCGGSAFACMTVTGVNSGSPVFDVNNGGTHQFDVLDNGNVGVASSTPRSLFSIGTTNGINFSTGTSTFSSLGGINLTHGCFALNGVCLTSGGGSGVSAVTGNWPILSSGGSTPNITWGGSASSTNRVAGQIDYSTGVNTYGQVATGTVTQSGPITVTSGQSVIGTGLTIGCSTCLTGNQTVTLSGDVTGSGATAITATLATVNTNTGSFGGSTAIPVITLNGKGLATAASTAVVIAPAGTLSGTTLNSSVVTSSLTSVGTLGSLTVSGTVTATIKQYPSFTYATTTAWSGTTTIPLGTSFVAETWNGVQCFTDTGTLNVSFRNGSTNLLDMLNASTTVGSFSFSTNNSFTAATKRYVLIGTPASSPTSISCTISKSVATN